MDPKTTPYGPAWTPSPGRLAKLRERARHRQIIRDLCEGDHRRLFIEAGLSNHTFGKIVNNRGQLNELVAMFNVIDLAPGLHAAVLVGNPAVISTADGFDEQDQTITMIRSESMFDALLMRATKRATVDGEAPMRIHRHPTYGYIAVLDSVDTCLPLGEDGPDMQPAVWERRWILSRTIARKKTRYLRVERYRVIDGLGAVVENELYSGASLDLYADLTKLRRVPLVTFYTENTPDDLVPLGIDRNPIVRMVPDFDQRGWPKMLLDKSDIDMVDVYAAAFSRLARTMEQHGKPKMRIPEEAIDPETGEANLSFDAIFDPEKLFEYLSPDFDFGGMTTWVMKTTQLLLTRLNVSPALLGVKLEGGSMPDTFDKLRLESTNVMIRARASQPYFTAAISHLFWVGSMLSALEPGQGFAVGEVGVALRPEIPASDQDRARDIAEQMRERMLDELSALEELHGPERAMKIYERLKADDAAQAARAQASTFGMAGGFA